MIAMENCYPLDVPAQKQGNLVTNGKQNFKRGSFMIFPIITAYIT